jgi:putative oxidoreductase
VRPFSRHGFVTQFLLPVRVTFPYHAGPFGSSRFSPCAKIFPSVQSIGHDVRRHDQRIVMNSHPLLDHVRKFYALLNRDGLLLQSLFLLVVRLYWGWQFFGTGKGKLSDLSKPTAFFATLHIPFPAANAALAGATECIGGLLLVLGLASRLISIPLTVVMLVAYLTADSEALHAIFSDPDKFLNAAEFQFLFAVLIVLIFGPGVFSLDHLLSKKFSAPASATVGAHAEA